LEKKNNKKGKKRKQSKAASHSPSRKGEGGYAGTYTLILNIPKREHPSLFVPFRYSLPIQIPRKARRDRQPWKSPFTCARAHKKKKKARLVAITSFPVGRESRDKSFVGQASETAVGKGGTQSNKAFLTMSHGRKKNDAVKSWFKCFLLRTEERKKKGRKRRSACFQNSRALFLGKGQKKKKKKAFSPSQPGEKSETTTYSLSLSQIARSRSLPSSRGEKKQEHSFILHRISLCDH